MNSGASVLGSIPSLSECNPGLQLLEFNVLVAPEEIPEKTKSGLILADVTRDADKHAVTRGRLISVSPAAFNYDDAVHAVRPAVGSLIVYGKYVGTKVMGMDGREYLIMKDKDVGATIIEPATDPVAVAA